MYVPKVIEAFDCSDVSLLPLLGAIGELPWRSFIMGGPRLRAAGYCGYALEAITWDSFQNAETSVLFSVRRRRCHTGRTQRS